ncbi:type II toxin-antitoxin system RelE/ParE family toxin [Pinirhizobacter sp.]|jgi:plasmid stabilization system protein ParE|uniref:type II toxin-antitoxin system RelE/ParE family toxin n=1 Tax=Pinirhizobacter sp. TaxID=2950432 RepID=UPI002F41AC6A
MKVEWMPAAEEDRLRIWTYIAAEDVGAAMRMDERFKDSSEQLAMFPRSAPRGVVRGTRELVPHANYRLVYEIKSDVVRVLALVHVSRQWPPEDDQRDK